MTNMFITSNTTNFSDGRGVKGQDTTRKKTSHWIPNQEMEQVEQVGKNIIVGNGRSFNYNMGRSSYTKAIGNNS